MKLVRYTLIALFFAIFMTVSISASDISLSLNYNNVGGSFANRDGRSVCIFNTVNQYSAPIITDLDNDGRNEIVFCNAAINVADAATGTIKWRVNSGYDRCTPFAVGADKGITYNDIVIEDIDGDGFREIISVHGNGWISVLTFDGYFKQGFPKKITDNLCTGVCVGDTDNDGKHEIAVAVGSLDAKSVYLYDYRGNLVSGWPQLSDEQNCALTNQVNDSAYSYGIFKGGIAMSDIDGDGCDEILAATDTSFVSAYNGDGTLVRANEEIFQGRSWGAVGFFETAEADYDLSHSNKWGSFYLTENSPRKYRYHAELGHSIVVPCDIDSDGKEEILLSAVMVDAVNDYSDGLYDATRYMTFFICNSDRTRYLNSSKGYDWSVCPTDTLMGPQILNDALYSLCSDVKSVPVVADIDRDGISDILINTYDGKLHCFSLDDSQHEKTGFPYSLNCSENIAEFATEPSCIDINCDGKLEIIFATFTLNKNHFGDTNQRGQVIILNSNGQLIASEYLPAGYLVYETLQEEYTNASKAAVAVADCDNDGTYEVAVNSITGSLCVFNINNSTTEEFFPYHCFNDVHENQWFYNSIEYCAHNSIFSGMTENTFEPNRLITREMFVVVLSKIAQADLSTGEYDISSFDDVNTGMWYTRAVEWAYQNELTGGVGNGIFGVGQPVTRQQLALFFMKYAQFSDDDVSGRADITVFPDYGQISTWAFEGVSWAYNEHIMAGNADGTFAPLRSAKRCEAAQMIYKIQTNQ